LTLGPELLVEEAALVRFAEAIAAGDEMDLGRAALLLGEMAEPGLDPGPALARLDRLAAEAGGLDGSARERVASLFGEEKLRGNIRDYNDPRNSFLHLVLERRLGIPISLAVVAMEVGRRMGVAVEGVPFPGHFLVRVRDGAAADVLDPFHDGALVSDGELLLRLKAATGRMGSLGPAELGPARKWQILRRMLQNLKAVYLGKEELGQALKAVERLLVLRPEEALERRDRGVLLARLGRHGEAEADLRAYLAARPEAPDADEVRTLTDEVRARRGPLN
jgi:regulator of sirC expression with transglutaminase-like and TPR domain